MLAPEIAEAIAAKVEEAMAEQAKVDKIPVWEEYCRALKAFTDAGALLWIATGFAIYVIWDKVLR